MISIRAIILFLGAALIAAAAASAQTDPVRRFALIIGANDGGPERARLRYAVTDARAVMAVLKNLGGVDATSGKILVEPRRADMLNALADLSGSVLQARKTYRRVEVIVYYSGHADEEGILLAGEKIYYRDLRRAILAMPADVRIAILDSCASGAFTAAKGGRLKAPFMVDASHNMKGTAFITSSSANEVSQESDRIKASFFTHALVTGLRGAADLQADGRITLSEAYQYAYAETLARTEKTLRGPQHPGYQIMMAGAGDVVLTELRRGSASLMLPRPVAGRVYIRDGKRTLVAELNKHQGRELLLSLGSGRFTVLNDRDGRLAEQSVELRAGEQLALDPGLFVPVTREQTYARGDGDPDRSTERREEKPAEPFLQKGGFIDSTVRIEAIVGGGLIQGGLDTKERRVLRVYRYDMAMAYFNYGGYRMYNAVILGGASIDLLLPAAKRLQSKPFDATGFKAGLRLRYDNGTILNVIMPSGGVSINGAGKLFMGRLAQYHTWHAGPVFSLVMSPRSNVVNVLLTAYATGGQVFSGTLTAEPALRGASWLWLRMAGIYGTPTLSGSLLPSLLLRGSTTHIQGWSVRGGLGPEVSLNRWFPLTLGLHATVAWTDLTMARALPAYADGNRRAGHWELGGELTLGVHF